jgi:hypothetical protein
VKAGANADEQNQRHRPSAHRCCAHGFGLAEIECHTRLPDSHRCCPNNFTFVRHYTNPGNLLQDCASAWHFHGFHGNTGRFFIKNIMAGSNFSVGLRRCIPFLLTSCVVNDITSNVIITLPFVKKYNKIAPWVRSDVRCWPEWPSK